MDFLCWKCDPRRGNIQNGSFHKRSGLESYLDVGSAYIVPYVLLFLLGFRDFQCLWIFVMINTNSGINPLVVHDSNIWYLNDSL